MDGGREREGGIDGWTEGGMGITAIGRRVVGRREDGRKREEGRTEELRTCTLHVGIITNKPF